MDKHRWVLQNNEIEKKDFQANITKALKEYLAFAFRQNETNIPNDMQNIKSIKR